MVQSFNLNGIIQSFRIFIQPRLIIPQLSVENFSKINFNQLKNNGIKLIILDKDNCITEPYKNELYHEFKGPMNELKKSIDEVIIFSNSAGSQDDKNDEQLNQIEKSLNIKVFKHIQKKPLGGDEVMRKYPQLKPSEVAMVGDRLFTDILFGNLNGFLTIHTSKVLSLENDNFWAAKIRNFEYKLLNLFQEKLHLKAYDHPSLRQ